jgi:hypothetical protein
MCVCVCVGMEGSKCVWIMGVAWRTTWSLQEVHEVTRDLKADGRMYVDSPRNTEVRHCGLPSPL